ncbi:MAG TPA: hypothetical protein VJN89_09945 [Candidatus Acidoferrum sp.]|nr:hypothetical protein [Candidatus Acidoferrum sp.]
MARTTAIAALALVGFAQMAGDILHSSALKAVAAATAASPAPKVFSAVKGLETFSTLFFIEWSDAKGAERSVEITPERYANLRGPYNRRNVYGAVLAYGPVLESDPHTLRLFNAISSYALCGKAPLLRELGIPPDSIESMRIRLQVRPQVVTPDLPLILRPHCS